MKFFAEFEQSRRRAATYLLRERGSKAETVSGSNRFSFVLLAIRFVVGSKKIKFVCQSEYSVNSLWRIMISRRKFFVRKNRYWVIGSFMIRSCSSIIWSWGSSMEERSEVVSEKEKIFSIFEFCWKIWELLGWMMTLDFGTFLILFNDFPRKIKGLLRVVLLCLWKIIWLYLSNWFADLVANDWRVSWVWYWASMMRSTFGGWRSIEFVRGKLLWAKF